MFVIPLILTLLFSILNKPKLLIVTSIWSLPVSLYFLSSESFLKYIIVGPIILVLAGFFMIRNKKSGYSTTL